MLALFESLGLIGLQATVFLAPPVVRLHRHAELPGALGHLDTLAQRHFCLTQLANDLLYRVPDPRNV